MKIKLSILKSNVLGLNYFELNGYYGNTIGANERKVWHVDDAIGVLLYWDVFVYTVCLIGRGWNISARG